MLPLLVKFMFISALQKDVQVCLDKLHSYYLPGAQCGNWREKSKTNAVFRKLVTLPWSC